MGIENSNGLRPISTGSKNEGSTICQESSPVSSPVIQSRVGSFAMSMNAAIGPINSSSIIGLSKLTPVRVKAAVPSLATWKGAS